ncbi:hypothetical protein EDC01DRAFT_790417, partial [Geopyxis carbonaria]
MSSTTHHRALSVAASPRHRHPASSPRSQSQSHVTRAKYSPHPTGCSTPQLQIPQRSQPRSHPPPANAHRRFATPPARRARVRPRLAAAPLSRRRRQRCSGLHVVRRRLTAPLSAPGCLSVAAQRLRAGPTVRPRRGCRPGQLCEIRRRTTAQSMADKQAHAYGAPRWPAPTIDAPRLPTEAWRASAPAPRGSCCRGSLRAAAGADPRPDPPGRDPRTKSAWRQAGAWAVDSRSGW